jgi:hypothetical protein
MDLGKLDRPKKHRLEQLAERIAGRLTSAPPR